MADKRAGRPQLYGQPTIVVKASVPLDVDAALTEEAAERGTSRPRVVVEALRRFLARRLKAGG